MKRLLDFWRKHFLAVEAGIIIIFTILFASWFLLFGGEPHVDALMKDNRGNIYRTTVSFPLCDTC